MIPKAILFDLDGTILDGDSGLEDDWRTACELACAQDGRVSADALLEAIHARRAWFWSEPELALAGRMDLKSVSGRIAGFALADLGHDAPELAAAIGDDYRRRRNAAMAPFAGAIETLQRARDRGIPLALVTNGEAAGQRAKVERFGLAPYFACIVIEGEFGCGKPDERVFRHALATVGCAPEDAWFVGDYLEADIETPVRLGMHAVWVDPRGRGLPPSSQIQPHRTVRSIAELFDSTV